MCVVSMIMDHYENKWQPLVTPPDPTPGVIWPWHTAIPGITPGIQPPTISPEEIAEFRRLLERAREYDKRNNEPDCELEEKKKKFRELAEQLGVKIDFL